MELIRVEEGKLYDLGPLSIALGEFDGLHKAHQALINKAVKKGRELKIKSAVFSFYPHPASILKKGSNYGYITPMKAKIKKLKELGVDYFIIIPFTLELSKLLPGKFIEKYLNIFEIKNIVVGFDYRFGYLGSGNPATLKEFFNVEIVKKIAINDEKVGSSQIRSYLMNGQMEKVCQMLGRYYNITGTVRSGNQVGRTFGIRTANIQIEEEYQTLRKGVYAVYVGLENNVYFGVCNIGNNPTINYIETPRLEVHILDFNDEIYGQTISVDFVRFLRDEFKFSSVEKMVEQINKDIINTKSILEKNI